MQEMSDWLNTTVNNLRGSLSQPRQGMFSLTVNNRKKRGYKSLKNVHCQGTLYESGHIHLDTYELPVRDFLSMHEMVEYLHPLGDQCITWLETTTYEHNEGE